MTKKRDSYGFSLIGRTSKITRQWSGGVIDSSLLESFAPLLVPVYKSNCSSALKYFETEASGYIRLLEKDKSSFGFLNVLTVNGENRLFTEVDTLQGLYSAIYYDSVSTNDQYQRSTLTNTSAIYFKNEFLSYSGGLGASFWNYRNGSLYRDTFEMDITQRLEFSKRKLSLSHEASFNLVGAAQTWGIRNHLKYRFKKYVIEWNSTSFGFLNVLTVNGENRLFTEVDTLQGLYSAIYYDSVSTNDQYQRSTLTNTSAIYFKNEFLSYSGGLGASFWNYRNGSLYRDTFEMDITQRLEFSKRKLSLSHEASFNLVGAAQTWGIRNHLKYRFKKYVIEWNSTFGQKLPEMYQRFYSANNVFYSNANQSLESYTRNTLDFGYTFKQLKLNLGYLLQTNAGVYFYDPLLLNWSNETSLSSNISQQTYLNSIYSYKRLVWNQSYRFTLSNTERTILPKHQLHGSFLTSLGLFKAKKLQLTFGLSYCLTSKTNIIPLLENVGVFDLLNVSEQNNQSAIFTMGGIIAMEIETFRFFVKLSNIGYLWNSTAWQYIDGIYLPEAAVRVGLTWDFWN